MAYKTWATNDVPSAADFNASAWSDPISADVTTDETTTSTTYTDLATSGPAVTMTLVSGQTALVIVSCSVTSASSTVDCYMSFAVSGASTLAAADANAALATQIVGSQQAAFRVTLFTATSTGSHTFTAKYRGGTTSHFARRRIIVKKF